MRTFDIFLIPHEELREEHEILCELIGMIRMNQKVARIAKRGNI